MSSWIEFAHVDVFSSAPLGGNGVTVFFGAATLDKETRQALALESRQVESVFLGEPDSDGNVDLRVHTPLEELPFAGHPLLGAAAALHHRFAREDARRQWTIRLEQRDIRLISRRQGDAFECEMEQGPAEFLSSLAGNEALAMARAFGLEENDLADQPAEIVSTGLPYLILPLQSGLEKARVCESGLGEKLRNAGAWFAYLLDIRTFTARSFENDGSLEDPATASAAGPAAAWLVRHGRARQGEAITIRQGAYCGRLSEISACVHHDGIRVGGSACVAAEGKWRHR